MESHVTVYSVLVSGMVMLVIVLPFSLKSKAPVPGEYAMSYFVSGILMLVIVSPFSRKSKAPVAGVKAMS